MKTKFLIPVICFVIGFGLVNQAKVTEGQNVYVSPSVIEEYKTSIESEEKEIQKINERMEETRQQLSKYEAAQNEEDFEGLSKELSAEVSKYKMFAGYETMRGPGVKITIDDGTRDLYEWEDINNLLVHDRDLLIVVNDLRRNGAEAISINGQRIASSTSILCSGYTVRINGQVYARPYIIRAIGDGKRMAASLISPEGYGTSLKDWGVQFSVEVRDEITISGYADAPKNKYAKNAKEV